MKKKQKAHSEPRLRFQDVVESIPDEVAAFFQKFETSRDQIGRAHV